MSLDINVRGTNVLDDLAARNTAGVSYQSEKEGKDNNRDGGRTLGGRLIYKECGLTA